MSFRDEVMDFAGTYKTFAKTGHDRYYDELAEKERRQRKQDEADEKETQAEIERRRREVAAGAPTVASTAMPGTAPTTGAASDSGGFGPILSRGATAGPGTILNFGGGAFTPTLPPIYRRGGRVNKPRRYAEGGSVAADQRATDEKSEADLILEGMLQRDLPVNASPDPAAEYAAIGDRAREEQSRGIPTAEPPPTQAMAMRRSLPMPQPPRYDYPPNTYTGPLAPEDTSARPSRPPTYDKVRARPRIAAPEEAEPADLPPPVTRAELLGGDTEATARTQAIDPTATPAQAGPYSRRAPPAPPRAPAPAGADTDDAYLSTGNARGRGSLPMPPPPDTDDAYLSTGNARQPVPTIGDRISQAWDRATTPPPPRPGSPPPAPPVGGSSPMTRAGDWIKRTVRGASTPPEGGGSRADYGVNPPPAPPAPAPAGAPKPALNAGPPPEDVYGPPKRRRVTGEPEEFVPTESITKLDEYGRLVPVKPGGGAGTGSGTRVGTGDGTATTTTTGGGTPPGGGSSGPGSGNGATPPPPRALRTEDPSRRTAAFDPGRERIGAQGETAPRQLDERGNVVPPSTQEIQTMVASAVSQHAQPGGQPPVIGEGRVSRENYQALVAEHNQGGQLTDGQALLIGMHSKYRQLLKRGKVKEAATMAWGLIQAANMEAASLGMYARDQIQAGDPRYKQTLARALDIAPDGMNHKATSYGIETSDQNGNVTGRTQLDGKKALAIALGLGDGSLMWNTLQQAAEMLKTPDRNAEGRGLRNDLTRLQIEHARQRLGKLRAGGQGESDQARVLADALRAYRGGGGGGGGGGGSRSNESLYENAANAEDLREP